MRPVFFTLIAHLLIATAARGDDPPPPTPNVLLITIEDTNLDVSLFNPTLQTPNVDRLAARGVSFDNAYCPSPVCSPSRAAMFSGMRPPTTGQLSNLDLPLESINNAVPMLPLHFRNQGYYTVGINKLIHDAAENVDAWTSIDRSSPTTTSTTHPIPIRPAATAWSTGAPTRTARTARSGR